MLFVGISGDLKCSAPSHCRKGLPHIKRDGIFRVKMKIGLFYVKNAVFIGGSRIKGRI